MKYNKVIMLKDKRECTIRNGEYKDGAICLELFNKTHEETDYLFTYPEESTRTVEWESEFLQSLTDGDSGIEMVCMLDGKCVGMAGFDCVRDNIKTRHRAEFGVSVLKDYWGLGVGRKLCEACIECAKMAGYEQLELDVVSENKRALALYESLGFVEYGRNPRGFKSKYTGYQELVYMRLEL